MWDERQSKDPYIIAMETIWTSCGNTSLAILRVPGKSGPETNPTMAVEKAFSIFECTSQMRRCITSIIAKLTVN